MTNLADGTSVAPGAAGGRGSIGGVSSTTTRGPRRTFKSRPTRTAPQVPRSAGAGVQQRALRRPILLAATVALLGGLVALVVSAALGERWRAEATVVHTATADPLLFNGTNDATTQRSLLNAAGFAVSETVLEPAAQTLPGFDDWADLRGAVTVTPEPGSSLLTISAWAHGRQEAQDIVAAVTESFVEASRRRAVDIATATAAAARAGARSAESGERGVLLDLAARADVVAQTVQPVTVLSQAPPVRTRPVLLRDVATGAVFGLLLTAALLLLPYKRGRSVVWAQDAAELLGLPVAEVASGEIIGGSSMLDQIWHLIGQHPSGRLVVVPAGASSVSAAAAVAALLRTSMPVRPGPSGLGYQVEVAGDPLTSVVAPLVRTSGAVIFAIEQGAPAREVRTSHLLSKSWDRPADAAIIVGP